MRENRYSAYRIMWLWVYFDLPTETKRERQAASTFRNKLLKDGFSMFQYSVYLRHCASRENAQVHINRVKSILPDKGKVCILRITDKQFEQMEQFYGQKKETIPKAGAQLELF